MDALKCLKCGLEPKIEPHATGPDNEVDLERAVCRCGAGPWHPMGYKDVIIAEWNTRNTPPPAEPEAIDLAAEKAKLDAMHEAEIKERKQQPLPDVRQLPVLNETK